MAAAQVSDEEHSIQQHLLFNTFRYVSIFVPCLEPSMGRNRAVCVQEPCLKPRSDDWIGNIVDILKKSKLCVLTSQ